MPYRLFHDLLDTNDLCIVMLEHIDYISKLEGNNSPYGYAAYSISKLKHPLKEMKSKLRTLSGVGAFTEKIILQILENKRPTFYDKLFKVFK